MYSLVQMNGSNFGLQDQNSLVRTQCPNQNPNKYSHMRATELIKETTCPRTRATECSCSKLKTVTESLDTVVAQCDLQHSDTVKGTILLMQGPGTPTLIKGTISGLTPGKHGFHIHEFGDMSQGCKSMGAHYNPVSYTHLTLPTKRIV